MKMIYNNNRSECDKMQERQYAAIDLNNADKKEKPINLQNQNMY